MCDLFWVGLAGMSLILNNPQNVPHFKFSLGLSHSRETGSGERCGGEGGREEGKEKEMDGDERGRRMFKDVGMVVPKIKKQDCNNPTRDVQSEQLIITILGHCR